MKVVIRKTAFDDDSIFVGYLAEVESFETDFEFTNVVVFYRGNYFTIPIVEYSIPSRLILELF